MNLKLRAQLARLGPVQAAPRHPFGSAGEVRLVPAGAVRKVSAALALVSRGFSMREARDAVGVMIEQGEVTVTLPAVEDRHTLAVELAECGIAGDVYLQPVQNRPQLLQRLPEESGAVA